MKLTKQQCDILADKIRRYVINRTIQKNVDFQGKPFKKYSPKYESRKGVKDVDLNLTGKMLLTDFYVEIKPIGTIRSIRKLLGFSSVNLKNNDVAGLDFQDIIISYGFNTGSITEKAKRFTNKMRGVSNPPTSIQKYYWNAYGHNVVRNGKTVGQAPPRDFLGAVSNKPLMSGRELFAIIREVL